MQIEEAGLGNLYYIYCIFFSSQEVEAKDSVMEGWVVEHPEFPRLHFT